MFHISEELLNTYLDEMLDESSRQKVKAHLDTCDQCSAQVNEMRALFSTLEDLPDMPLTRDLTPGVLAQLPKAVNFPVLWRQPAFVIQTLLTILLLAVNFPMLRTLGQQIALWGNEIVPPTIKFPTLAEMASQLTPLLTWKFGFSFALPELSLTIPTIPTIPFSPDTNTGLLLVIFAGLLWVVGNFSLLRNRPEAQE